MWNGSSFQRLYRLLSRHVRPQLGTLALVTGLASVVAFCEKAPFVLIIPLLNRVLFPGAAETADPEASSGLAHQLSQAFDGVVAQAETWVFGAEGAGGETQSRVAVLLAVGGLVAFLAILLAVTQYSLTLLSRRVALQMVIGLRERLARHIIGLSMRYHGERQFGDVLSRISADANQTLQAVNLTLKDLVQQPLQLVAALGVAAFAAPKPTLGIVLALPLLAWPISKLGRKIRKRSTKSLASLGASVQVLTQMFTGIRTVKAFRAEERELERYRAVNRDYLSNAMRMVRAVATNEATLTLLSHLGFAALLVAIGWFSLQGGMFETPGDLTAFVAAIGTIYTHVKRITTAVNHVQESSGAADRLQNLLDERQDIVEREGARPITTLGRGIEFDHVTFGYPGQPRPALEDLSLHVRPGETLALVGPSGAGKTTLIDLIARFIEASKGRILVDGSDLRELKLDDWTHMYAMVGQVPFLFHATVRENIQYGRPSASQAEVEAAARAAHIHDFILTLPQAYDTRVGDQGARLSGGQRQRITIARAILKDAPLLLLDEATSALDSESEAEVQRALDELMHDRTVIVIAHRLSTIRGADRIAVLDQGRLVELGRHEELLARKGAYARLYAMQFHGAAVPT